MDGGGIEFGGGAVDGVVFVSPVDVVFVSPVNEDIMDLRISIYLLIIDVRLKIEDETVQKACKKKVQQYTRTRTLIEKSLILNLILGMLLIL